MENKLTPELIEKAKTTKSAEEIVVLAKENGVTITDEEASAYFEQLNQKTGELSDEELDNVSGGCYRSNGNLSVSSLYSCEHWKCSKCGGTEEHEHFMTHMDGNSLSAYSMLYKKQCSCCAWSTSASTICTNPLNNKNNK